MKASRSFAISFAVIALAVVASAPASAQERNRDRDIPGDRSRDAPGDRVSSFRGDFNKILDHYDGVFRRLGNARGIRLTADARQSLRVVSDEQLARVFERIKVPDLSAAVQAAEVLESHTPVRSAPMTLTTPGFPNAPPILSECDNIAHDSGFTFGALVAFQVLRAVLAAANYACLEVIVVLGEGGNFSLVCEAFAIAEAAAAIPFELADFCGGEEDSALLQGSYDRLDHIHTDLDSARTEILTSIDTHTTQIINNDNANRDILVAELRKLSCDIMRLLNTPEGQRASSNSSCVGQPQFPYNFPEKRR